MMHHLSADHLELLLADDFKYASQWVSEELTSKRAYLDNIRPKLEALCRSGSRVWAELGELPIAPRRPCLVIAQGDKESLVATVLVEVEGSEIKRLDMCMTPPRTVRRSGEYPV